MSLGEHLTELLLADAKITELVGQKIYRVKGISPVVPGSIKFSKTLVERLRTFQGFTGVAVHNVAFNCFGEDAGQAEQIADAVIEVLEDYKGTREGVQILDTAIIRDEDDDYSEDVDEFRSIVVAVVTHKKTT